MFLKKCLIFSLIASAITGTTFFLEREFPRNFLFASIFTQSFTNPDTEDPDAIPTYDEETIEIDFLPQVLTANYRIKTQGDTVTLHNTFDTLEISEAAGTGPDIDPGDGYGIGFAEIGDLDGDGVNDLAVGAIGDDDGGSEKGAIYIHFMNADKTIRATQKISETTGNGPTLAVGDSYGTNISSLGDLDGDGVTDLLVGAYQDDSSGGNAGAVYVTFLNADGTAKSHQKIAQGVGGGPVIGPFAFYGHGVATIGDLDGDTVQDIAVGSIWDGTSGSRAGAVYIHLMNTDGTVKATQKITGATPNGPGISTNDWYGVGMEGIGDLDGDTIPDLAVGAWSDDDSGANSGAVFIHFLNSDGTVKATQKITELQGGGPPIDGGSDYSFGANTADGYGIGITNLGDLDGDGIVDLAIGAIGDDDGGLNRGATYIHFMNTDGTVKSFQKISQAGGNGLENLHNNSNYGSRLARIGDIDNNGTLEVAVGAWQHDGAGAFFIHSFTSEGLVDRTDEYFASGSYATDMSVAAGDLPDFFGWSNLLANQVKPANTDINYEIFSAGIDTGSGTCTGGSLAGPFSILNVGGGVDGNIVGNLSSIDPIANTDLCLQVDFTTTDDTVTPALSGWRQNYHVDRDGDGMTEFYENYLHTCLSDSDDGSTNVNFGPDGDPDNDAYTNLEELNRGQNPCEFNARSESGKVNFSGSDGFGQAVGSGKAHYPVSYKNSADFDPINSVDRRISPDSVIRDKRIGEIYKGTALFEAKNGEQVFRGYFPGRVDADQYRVQNQARYRGVKTQRGLVRGAANNSRSQRQSWLSANSFSNRANDIQALHQESEFPGFKSSAENSRRFYSQSELRNWMNQSEKNAENQKKDINEHLRAFDVRPGRSSFRSYSAAETMKHSREKLVRIRERRKNLAPKRNTIPLYVSQTKIEKQGNQGLTDSAENELATPTENLDSAQAENFVD